MIFSNDQDLPNAVHQFLIYSDYNVGGPKFDISATKLIDSPQIAQHWRDFGKEVVEDSSARLYSAMGSGIHSRFEQANASNPDVMLEKRFMAEFPHPIEGKMPSLPYLLREPLTLSGQIDVFEFKTKTLADLKNVSAWKLVHGDYDSFERQLNIGAYLMKQNGFEVDSLEVYAFCRDWSRGRQGERDYPDQPIQIIPIHMWEEDQQLEYITERLELHFGEGEKACTPDDMWAKPGTFAVKQKGKKRALRVLPTKEKANSWISSQGLSGKESVSIEERPATYARCESYCAFGKMGVCTQFNATKDNQGG